jgi:hypothetical protein
MILLVIDISLCEAPSSVKASELFAFLLRIAVEYSVAFSGLELVLRLPSLGT